MKILFIGGTGLISSACSERALAQGHALYLLNRGQSAKYAPPEGATLIKADVRAGADEVRRALGDLTFDAVVDWVAFTPEHIEVDLAAFAGRTRQFVFISSASCYQRPATHHRVLESTPLANPFWQYSRDKIACEERLMRAHRETGFPVTIVRPSLTYGPSQIPLCTGSWQHPWTIMARMKRGKPVIVPGDGSSLWCMTWNADFAIGFNGLLGREQAIGHAFHITSDEVLSWDSLYRQAAHALGVEPRLVHVPSELIAAYDADATGSLIGDKATSVVFDNSKIKSLVPEFVCTVPWQTGVRRAVAWFEADAGRRTLDAAAEARWDRILEAYRRAWPDGKADF